MAISILPDIEEDLVDEEENQEEEAYPDTTWILNEDTKTIGALSDDHEACVTQAAKIAQYTAQQEHEMFSISFGSRLNELIGETRPHVYAAIEAAIRECLEEDDRIDGVGNFRFSDSMGNVKVNFDMYVSGEDIEMVTEVDTNGT